MKYDADVTFTIRIRDKGGETVYARTRDHYLAFFIAREWLKDYKNVKVINNKNKKSIAKFVYGHQQ